MRRKSVELISSQKLAAWIKAGKNVLFEGKHGVGKTSIIIEAWKKAGLRYLYFSGATMDPFIDFVGVPVKIGTKHGEVIKLLRPEQLANSNVQAIFIDEFNRTHKKVRNAIMELIQFKTINGKQLSPDLKIIWAAVNPDNADGDNDYDTDRLDPAQRDRFQIHVTIPYACDLEYFTKRFGEKTATTAVKWWNTIDEKIRDKVSPRRLDYALTELKHGRDMRDVLPPESNVSQLMQLLKHKGKTLDEVARMKDATDIKKFFADENNYSLYVDEVVKVKRYNRFVHLFPAEKISTLLGGKTRNKVKRIIFNNMKHHTQRAVFGPILVELSQSNQNNALTRWAKLLVRKFRLAPKVKPGKKTKGVLGPVVGGKQKSYRIPGGKSSLGTLLQLMVNELKQGNKLSEKALTKELMKLKQKTYRLTTIQKLLIKACAWLNQAGFSNVKVTA